ncbi:MAG: hypothetical protein ABSF29_04860 [Tepidisphaeraceae bacterium]
MAEFFLFGADLFLGLGQIWFWKFFLLKEKGVPSEAHERKRMDAIFALSAIGRDDYGGFLVLNILCLDRQIGR